MTELVGVIDYDAGNIGSIVNMLGRIGAKAKVVADADEIDGVDRLILPGVGAFDHGVRELHRRGFHDRLSHRSDSDVPLLGVCLGMHLLLESSEEGELRGLGLVKGSCRKFTPSDTRVKVPHMGWNDVEIRQPTLMKDWLLADSRFYFVHSYAARPADDRVAVGSTNYIDSFCSMIDGGANLYGVQFHPEKSHRFGMAVLAGFVAAPC